MPDQTKKDKYLSFPLMARLKLYDKTKKKIHQEFSLKARKALEDYYYQMDIIKNEMKEELDAIDRLKIELEDDVQQEIGEQYSLLDTCPHSGKVLRHKEEKGKK